MKRLGMGTWLLVAVAVLLVVFSAQRIWQSNFDRSIEVGERFNNVENGSAYDRAAVDLGVVKKITLPHDAVVRRTGEAGKIQLFMVKTLAFGGHPPESMSIWDARKNMGCAVKVEGDALVVATFGEWSTKEGGARMRLVAAIPEGFALEQKNGLSGPDSGGREWHGQYLTKPRDAKGGYWYGPASPAEGWTAVPDVSDPDRTAK